MSDRQYGVRYREDQSPDRQYVSPIEAYNSLQPSHLRRDRRPVPQMSRPPPPPQHRAPPAQIDTSARYSARRQSTTTPLEDNYGVAAAGGGITGIATGIADTHPRDSGFNALRDIDNLYSRPIMSPSPALSEQHWTAAEHEYVGSPRDLDSRPSHQPQFSESSIAPLMSRRSLEPSPTRSPPRSPQRGVQRRSVAAAAAGAPDWQPRAQQLPYGRSDGYDDNYIDPQSIADDGDDDIPVRTNPRRHPGPIDLAGAAGAGAGIANAFGPRDASGNYGPVPGGEKSEWSQKSRSNKNRKWLIGCIIAALLVIAGIVGGVVGGIISNKKNSNASYGGTTPSSDTSGDYDINSSEVKALLNNPDLHRVFPGMDYTPLNAQYPACLTVPPNQNNITLDVAMLSQLTPAIRLYGTDCNQTEMLLTAIDRLGYNSTIKVWLGVWLENNQTTNDRQVAQMYDILNTYPSSHFEGVIVGNEVLFRQDMTEAQLGTVLQDVKQNLTKLSIDLPVATSDLGSDWTEALTEDVDIVMGNVHPFFAGVTPEVAAGWTWSFWQSHDVSLTSGGTDKNIISEVGWPSAGGNDCGTDNGCPNPTAGSVAGIDEMNTFMGDWVCQSLANGTTYFWFEAFDEPWKVIYNTPTDQWESKWGLMDSNRNLKTGLNIPDCGGKTAG